ncbi:flagellar basal body protein FliL [Allokutzneria sp. A3M-2-11 16]|uniref:flagellar basal body protein FliL n=1 Tax=Allokutzneria sp. A3M-2-11 16 TaxID=2962043 RepID=UPI0020B8AFE1|nr:flagellar basal body protein FliL [Allokutzneria sp. A3M-2-11 16]MCP3802198.1 flagellar basal body protein FliL [Allokutzneria sp. A3M-2-11 16]
MSTPGNDSGGNDSGQPAQPGPAEGPGPQQQPPRPDGPDMTTPPMGVPAQPQPQPGQPQSGQFQPGQFQPGQFQSGQPQPGQFQQGQFPPGQVPPGYGPPPGYAPPKKKRTGVVVGVIVGVLALVAAGVTAIFAFSGAGANTPTAAATRLVEALGKGDIAGMMTSLAPAEAKLSLDYTAASMNELKRLEVMKPDANPDQLAGVELKAEGLRFDEAGEEQLNDHVAVAKLVAGKITVTSDTAKLPLADKFVDLAFPNGRIDQRMTQTIDIADVVRGLGGPVRIASVKVDGSWYASMFYTIADNILAAEEIAWPKQSIPANGAADPETAVRELVQAAFSGNPRRAFELLAPDEMGVLHDLGPLLLSEVQAGETDFGLRIVELKTTRKEVNGGTRVGLESAVVEVNGQRGSMRRVQDCYEVQDPQGQVKKTCAKDIVADFTSGMEESFRRNTGRALPQQLKDFAERIVRNFFDAGVMSTQVDGKHYVSPLRTFSELMLTVLRSLEPKDIEELAKAGK